ncbi:integrase catalytic domain-containing protein [Trichonephila clavipes]|nr:integrase catalytic domain-containing protein [Trichonephila clavipes]
MDKKYLLQLKSANLNKNVNVKTQFNVNDIVLGEEKVNQQLWRLGKIIEIHKGRDGKPKQAANQYSNIPLALKPVSHNELLSIPVASKLYNKKQIWKT